MGRRPNDITGQRFGMLVVEAVTAVRHAGSVVWTCICDCGTRVPKPTSYLRDSKRASCGCVVGDAIRFDLTGRRYGRLVMIEDAGRMKGGGRLWRAKCDCGTITVAPAKHVRHGTKSSCGCAKGGSGNGGGSRWAPNVKPGDRFGSLTVLELESVQTYRRWRCECDCGAKTVVRGTLLVNGQTKSCGCLRRTAPKTRKLEAA